MAISHADKTMVNHVRPDGMYLPVYLLVPHFDDIKYVDVSWFLGSSFHVVDYNSTTGVVIDRRTSQGYSNSSTWSRGQSWGIYGFANSAFLSIVALVTNFSSYTSS